MGSKRMAQTVGAVFTFFKPCIDHSISHGYLHGTIAHRFSWYFTFKKIYLRPISFVVSMQVGKKYFGENGT
jgi:hypothetical protein